MDSILIPGGRWVRSLTQIEPCRDLRMELANKAVSAHEPPLGRALAPEAAPGAPLWVAVEDTTCVIAVDSLEWPIT